MSWESPRRSLHALPPGTVLHDYVIDSELGSGGFSIVYLARHRLNPDWLFAIKEFLPRELAVRHNDDASVHPLDTEAGDAFQDGLRRFRDEAEQLRKFRNEPSVVSCLNYFEGNGTAYLVMDFDDGLPLSEFLRRREDAGQPFTEKDLLAVVEPLIEGLAVIHRAGVLHRDIKPGNIFVRQQDDITGRPAHPVLIDFGAAKQNYLTRHSQSRAPYTPGYAAYEQVSSEGDIGPWTDVYAVGALMWRMVAGGCLADHRLHLPDGADNAHGAEWCPTPCAAEKRAYALHRGQSDPMLPATELGVGRFSPALLQAVDRCLVLYPEDRLQDCAALYALLENVGVSKTAATQAQDKATKRNRTTITAEVGPALAGAVLRGHLPKYCGFAIAATLAGAGQLIASITRTSTWVVGSALAIAWIIAVTLLPTPADRDPVPASEEPTASPVSIGASADGPISSTSTVEASDTSESPILGGNAILVVETVPSGARIAIADEEIGVTPLELSGLRAGRYEITLDHPAYQVLRLSEQPLTDGEVLRIERALTPATGRLTVLIQPREAWIELASRRLAEATPVTLRDLPAGNVELTLGAAGHRTATVQVDIPRDGLGTLEQALEPIPYGTLTLELNPPDAVVTLPDIDPSYRPGVRLPEGPHRVIVRRENYRSVERLVEVLGETHTRVELEMNPGSRFRDRLASSGEGPEMVVIPAGMYRMGCLNDGGDCADNEGPVHEVRISNSFALARYEVTVGDFGRFVEASGYRTESEGDPESGCITQEILDRNEWDWTSNRSWRNLEYEIEEDHPVTCVSWNDAQAYVTWLSHETGKVYRLPSESEWEYAARAGTTTRFHFGDDPGRLCDHGNVADRTEFSNGVSWVNPVECGDGEMYAATVGSYRTNGFGLYDLHGNVWEWVEDCWNENYAGAPRDGSAWLAGNCEMRVLRGGAWTTAISSYLRSAYRHSGFAGFRVNSYGHRRVDYGFRVARTLTP